MTPKNGDGFESPMLKGDKGDKPRNAPEKSGEVYSAMEKESPKEANGHKNGPRG